MFRRSLTLGLAVVALASLSVAACVTAPDTEVSSAFTNTTAPSLPANGGTQATSAVVASTPGAPGSHPSDATPVQTAAATSDDVVTDYRISPLDVLEVDVFQTPDLNKTVEVDASGKISLPLIGDVVAGGKTTHQLELDVAAALGAKYLQSPEVSVYVKDAVSQRVTVEGAVQHPGIFPTTGRTSLMQVIALSGGLNEIADSSAVVVFRTTDGKRQAAVFDYKAIRTGKADDPILQGGDIVAVDESGAKATMRNLRETIGVLNLFTPLVPLI